MKRPDAAYAVAVELCRQLPDFVFRRDIEGVLEEGLAGNHGDGMSSELLYAE